MQWRSVKELQKGYLLKMFELADGKTYTDVDLNQVEKELGISENEGETITGRLRSEGYLDGGFGRLAFITSNGRIAIDSIMEKTYAEEELLVLEIAARLSRGKDRGWVIWNQLEKELPKLSYSLRDIVNELERKGYFIHEFDEGVKVGPQGFEFLQKRSNSSSAFVIQDNSIRIGDNSNVAGVAAGHNIQQSVSQSINPAFDTAIKALVEVVKASAMPAHEMRLALDDLVEIQKLAGMEKSPGIVARAISVIGTFKALAGAAGLVDQISPYLPHILAYFQN